MFSMTVWQIKVRGIVLTSSACHAARVLQ